MAQYMASLRKLAALDATVLLPGHGEPLTEPRAAIDALIAHRKRREAKVLRSVPAGRALALEVLVGHVYDDVDPLLHRVAMRSLLAHLLKLEVEGRVVADGAGWRRLDPAL
jgi:glyoxylase-like metal-dependent hydrolase (beta-lactamase superfamily II)